MVTESKPLVSRGEESNHKGTLGYNEIIPHIYVVIDIKMYTSIKTHGNVYLKIHFIVHELHLTKINLISLHK